MNVKLLLGERIKSLRKRQQLSQTDFSKLMNVRQSTVSRWENGIDQPDLECLAKMVDIFDCSYDKLLNRAAKTNY